MRTDNTLVSAFFILIIFGGLVFLNDHKDKKEQEARQRYQDSISIPAPMKEVRGYDYIHGLYVPYPSDQEIRELRKNNPEYIIRAPGRNIKSEKEIFEERMEQYIEDHHDEIIERYRD